jgi:CDP-paratose 2-epimerase
LRRVQGAGCTFHHGDIRNAEDLARLDEEYELLLECSAEPSVQVGTRGADACFMVQNNLVGTAVCLEFARARNLPLIFLSTSRVYPYDRINALAFREEASRYVLAAPGPGVSAAGIAVDFPLAGVRSLYGATKLASEFLIQEYSAQYGLPAIINRCGVIAGPWQMGKVDQGFVTFWIASHYFGQPLNYIGYGGRGKQVRDILHVDDLVDLVFRQAARIGEFRGDVFHAGGGAACSVSLRETTALCREATGRAIEIGSIPEARSADVIWFIMDNGRTESVFGWTPTRGLPILLQDTLAWIRDHEAMLAPIFRR